MLAIRKFQEERDAWEAEREELQRRCQNEEERREEVAKQLVQLSREVERLRSAQGNLTQTNSAAPRGACFDQVELAELKRNHHEKQLALMKTIDALRADVKRAELRNSQPDVLEKCETNIAEQRQDAAVADATKQLEEARAAAQRARDELRKLEDENIVLQENLNQEKQKVVELKRAAHGRAAAWKEQLEKITMELAIKQRLEEESTQLRCDNQRYQRELSCLAEREASAKQSADQFRREVDSLRFQAKGTVAEKTEELEQLSTTMGGQLMAMEQEFQNQLQQNTQLLELFLRHCAQPLSTSRRCCSRLASELVNMAGTNDFRDRELPPMFESNVNDLKTNLVKIVNILRYVSDVQEAWDALREPQDVAQRDVGQEQSQGVGWLRGIFA